ncbi:YdcF family protein [Microbacterium sp. 18062]|uniref:YdcF family protein n=1 Tax=Microbacterium sp. 18062 TaxID=2681410 RepID=UPI00135BD3F3|nr:YdcF family protein [Microbacterium sp. 18062]
MWLRALLVAPAVAACVLAWAEFVHRRASGRRLGDSSDIAPTTTEAVVVLGYRNRGRRANYVNRYRVRAGLRSFDSDAAERVLVLCGGRVAGVVAEAELMAAYARERGYTGPIRLEAESTTTWENIRNAIPLVEDAGTIKIVSNSLHAEKGRACLWRLRPDLARRLRRAREHRVGEIALLKPLAAIVGLGDLARLRVAHTR